MEVKTITVGQMQTNCYLLYDPHSLSCLIIDPGDEGDFITEEILHLHLKPQAIILTHGHYDHCLACLELQLNFGCPIFLNPKDSFLYQNAAKSARHWSKTTATNQPPTLPIPAEIKLGEHTIRVINTPGHTPGSISLYSKPYLFSGDTLFADGVGRTDYSYSSSTDLKKSLQILKKLPSGTEVYSGHGASPFFL